MVIKYQEGAYDMKTKTLAKPILLINQLILLLIITTFAMSVLAASPSITKSTKTTVTKDLKMAKGQPYVPPRKDGGNCA